MLADPVEMNNLARDPAHAAVKATLVTQLEAEKSTIATTPEPTPTGANRLWNGSFDTGITPDSAIKIDTAATEESAFYVVVPSDGAGP